MIIKETGAIKTHLNFFYLFGNKETGLTKAFAYILSANQLLLFSFLRELGIHISNTDKNFSNIEISIERKRIEGRTDIELLYKNKFHVIIEAKVGNNKVLQQKTQYLSSFEDVPQKVLCFISQINEYRKDNLNLKFQFQELQQLFEKLINFLKRMFHRKDKEDVYAEVVGDLYDNKIISEKTFDKITGWGNEKDKQKDSFEL